MTDNEIAKRKRTNGQTMIYKVLHRKLNRGQFRWSESTSKSCSTIDTRCVTAKWHEGLERNPNNRSRTQS